MWLVSSGAHLMVSLHMIFSYALPLCISQCYVQPCSVCMTTNYALQLLFRSNSIMQLENKDLQTHVYMKLYNCFSSYNSLIKVSTSIVKSLCLRLDNNYSDLCLSQSLCKLLFRVRCSSWCAIVKLVTKLYKGWCSFLRCGAIESTSGAYMGNGPLIKKVCVIYVCHALYVCSIWKKTEQNYENCSYPWVFFSVK